MFRFFRVFRGRNNNKYHLIYQNLTFLSLHVFIPHSALRTPHSALRTPHSAFRTPHSYTSLVIINSGCPLKVL